MAAIILSFLFNLLLFLNPNKTQASHGIHVHKSNSSDETALLAFKSAITYDPLNSVTSWSKNVSFCKWVGVLCSSHRHRVVSLTLYNMSLQGTISPFLSNLTFLRILDLSLNSLDGYIPYQLGRLSHLRKLYLFSNHLHGSIPTALSGIHSLRVISLLDNHLSGNIPSQLGFLPNLELIILGSNNLTGTIPNALGNISSLDQLDLGNNQFHGTIPWELGMLVELSLLALNANHLTGQIPSSLSNCTFLEVLDLNDNYITQEIPGELFSKNTNLMELYLSTNQLTGSLPLSLFNCSQLEQLELSGNRMSGIVPTELGKLYRLIWLNLGYNQFTSGSKSTLSILTALTNCSLLEVIQLSGNHLTGVMPSSVGQLSTMLRELDLDRNKITGGISPFVGNLTNLTMLDLDQNLLTGAIPSAISQLQNLEQLYIASNKLEGTIPREIGKLKTLGALNLGENKLSGSIPDSLAHLQQIRQLYLNMNHLTGIIPSSLGECLKLEDLNLSYNKLRGHIPPQVAGLSNLLMGFDLSNNLLQGPVPSELSKLDKVKAIDISANQLTGHIPFVLGSCVALEYLNLSCNQIKGPLPDSLSKLQNLQDLDLSSNELSGRIPRSLGKLKELQRLNFSMNKLSGKVPKDGVFKNLGPTSFIQNLGLCGPWVKLQACSAPKHKRHIHLKRIVIIIVGIATLVIWCSLMKFLWRCYCKRDALISFPSRLDHRKISLSELTNATDGFNEANLLGVGNFGKVYKGILNDGTMVAIKVLTLQNEQVSRSFVRECNVLRRVRHRNLVRIITAYSDPDFKALILPLMPNGSLDKFLHPEGPQSSEGHMLRLDLIQRLNIAIDIAQALEYLHHHCFVQVIHCDIKPSNVLLGEDMTAYLTDFGISRLIFGNSINSFTSTDTLKGSIGYIAPEYGVNGRVTTKGDVHSYGVMLLEMVTGKRPTDSLFVEGLNMHNWVSRGFPNTMGEVVDSSLLNGATSSEEDKVFNCLRQLISMSFLCTKESPQERTSMIDIVKILHSIRSTFLGVPSTPTFHIDLSSLLASTSILGTKSESQTSSSF